MINKKIWRFFLALIILLELTSFVKANLACPDIKTLTMHNKVYIDEDLVVLNENLYPSSPENPWNDYTSYEIIMDPDTQTKGSLLTNLGNNLIVPSSFKFSSSGEHTITYIFNKADGERCDVIHKVFIETTQRVHPSLDIYLSEMQKELEINETYNLTLKVENNGQLDIKEVRGFIDSAGLSFTNPQIDIPLIRKGETFNLYFSFTTEIFGENMIIVPLITSYESDYLYYPGFENYDVQYNYLTYSVVEEIAEPLPVGYAIASNEQKEKPITTDKEFYKNSFSILDIVKFSIIFVFLLALFFVKAKKE